MANGKIYLGLDIGTDSVGWAVTDGEYRLKKFRNNLMWGVHLFDEAQQSADRRAFRTARRRLDRRQQRINLLQDFFAAEILKKDEKFFLRLKESALLPEDSESRKHNIFFDDENYGDKEYFGEYPTIHHLICELMKSSDEHNVRSVYYACAYLLAHRGHFLSPVSKDKIDEITDFTEIYKSFFSALKEVDDDPPFAPDAEKMSEVLKKHIGQTAKDKELKDILSVGKTAKNDEETAIRYDQLTKLISGGKVELSNLFCKEAYKELEKNSVCVKNADFADTLDMLTGQIDELHLNLLAGVKAMYDWSLLVDILHGHKMISKSKVEIYDKHKKDLEELKYFVRKYLTKKDYDEIFREISDKANYVSYVYNAPSDDERSKYKKCSQEDFCKFLKPYLANRKTSDEDKERYEELKKKCEDSELCPKQVTTDNRVIPYQLYYAELKKILENASKYLPFLNAKDDTDKTVAEKILSIMEFRIPYYAGPLMPHIENNAKSQNSWLVRKAEGKIYPWNFREMVDEDASEDEFIRRMTCKCTYLAGEDVLPKYSLLYCKYTVLNEINNIKVNGVPITVEQKKRLYQDKFVDSKAKVTKKRIAEYFKSIGAYEGEIEISGIDDNIKSSLKSYHDFKRLIESGMLSENDVENIIERITVTTDKDRLKDWLKAKYSQLPESEIKYIIQKCKYKDYGRISRRFFEEILPIDDKTSEVLSDKSIISMLWDSGKKENKNLMQLLSSDYGYSKAVEAFNSSYYAIPEHQKNLSERLKAMYIPTAVRRSVTRTLDIVKELKTILKKAPDKIFIEMARGEGDTPKGKRTKSRKEQILEHLDDFGVDKNDHLRNELETADDGKLRSEKYFLYFMQLGKCAYTEKSISFEDLDNNSKWNIDHIWPQAKIKDDSLDNKVLVDTDENGKKGDTYPINPNIRRDRSGFWHSLYKKGLMSEKKYNRLIRSTPFTEEEKAGFIARQLVETRQSTKAVADILKELFPDTDIVYVKAGIVSEFRHDMDMLKCREINDLHHAKDAYLNIVMGNVYDTKFTKSPLNFVQSGERYSMKLFKKDQDGKESGLLTGKVQRGDTLAWDPAVSFKTVRDMMAKNSIRYVRYTYKRKGGLFNQMPERKKEGLVPRKDGLDTEKYGGYNNTTVSSFAVIQCKKDIIIIPVELMCYAKFFSDNAFMKKYAYDKLKFILPDKKYKEITKDDIQLPMIKYADFSSNRTVELKINSIVEVNGYPISLCSKDSRGKYIIVASPVSLVVDRVTEKYIKKILGYLEKYPNSKVTSYQGITKEQNLDIYDLIFHKCSNPPFNTWDKFADMASVLQNRRDVFCGLSVEEQIKALKEIVSILKSGRSVFCNLSSLNESKQSCISKLGAIITGNKKINSFVIVDQSPTGLFEKKSVNLLEL